MSHNVSPNAYRLGRTQLWSNVLSTSLTSTLFRHYYIYPLGMVERSSRIGQKTLYLLYYSLFLAYRYRSRFLYPRFYRHLRVSAWFSDVVFSLSETLLNGIWSRASFRFENRFTMRKPKANWQALFRTNMLRGSGSQSLWPLTVYPAHSWSIAGRSAYRSSERVRLLISKRILRPVYNIADSFLTHKIKDSISNLLRKLSAFKAVYVLLLKTPYRFLGARILRLAKVIAYLRGVNQFRVLGRIRDEVVALQDRNKALSETSARVEETPNENYKKRVPRQFFGEADIHLFTSQDNYMFSDNLFSSFISRELRRSVRVRSINVFKYMLIKGLMLPGQYLNHLAQLSGPKTRRDRYTYNSYTDIINVFFLQTRFMNIEWLILRVLKYALFKLHRRNIKLKYFFRFIHNVIMLMGRLDKSLTVFRIIVHGKIKGGTHRTKTETVGYGRASRNSIGSNLRYCFDNIYSKYGEYGMHLLVARTNQKVIRE